MENYCKIRPDLIQQGLMPGIFEDKWPETIPVNSKFFYRYLEEEMPDGFNIVIWSVEFDFITAANSIDFEFDAQHS
jgi:hypothetical protein